MVCVNSLLANTSVPCSIAWVFPQFKTSRSTTKATGTEVLLYGLLYKVGSRYISQENLLSFEHMQKYLVAVLIFSVARLFYIAIFGLKLTLYNKDWYTSVNFQDCILCGTIREKKVFIHIKRCEVSSPERGAIYFKCFLLPSDVRDVFWFLDISDNHS